MDSFRCTGCCMSAVHASNILEELAPGLTTMRAWPWILNYNEDPTGGTSAVFHFSGTRVEDSWRRQNTLRGANATGVDRDRLPVNRYGNVVLAINFVVTVDIQSSVWKPTTAVHGQFHEKTGPSRLTDLRIRDESGEDDLAVAQHRITDRPFSCGGEIDIPAALHGLVYCSPVNGVVTGDTYGFAVHDGLCNDALL